MIKASEYKDFILILHWYIFFRHAVLPEYCKYKVVPSLIEITLVKEVSGRWDALEAPVRKGNLYNKHTHARPYHTPNFCLHFSFLPSYCQIKPQNSFYLFLVIFLLCYIRNNHEVFQIRFIYCKILFLNVWNKNQNKIWSCCYL